MSPFTPDALLIAAATIQGAGTMITPTSPVPPSGELGTFRWDGMPYDLAWATALALAAAAPESVWQHGEDPDVVADRCCQKEKDALRAEVEALKAQLAEAQAKPTETDWGLGCAAANLHSVHRDFIALASAHAHRLATERVRREAVAKNAAGGA